jgi:hypothetical protein
MHEVDRGTPFAAWHHPDLFTTELRAWERRSLQPGR